MFTADVLHHLANIGLLENHDDLALGEVSTSRTTFSGIVIKKNSDNTVINGHRSNYDANSIDIETGSDNTAIHGLTSNAPAQKGILIGALPFNEPDVPQDTVIRDSSIVEAGKKALQIKSSARVNYHDLTICGPAQVALPQDPNEPVEPRCVTLNQP